MQLAAEIERALAELAKSGPLEAHENGRRLAGLADGLRYEVRPQGATPLLHLWSEPESGSQTSAHSGAQTDVQNDARNMVRRVVGIAEESDDHLSLEIQRFGRSRPEVLEIRVAGRERPVGKIRRESFGERCLAILQNQFADEAVESLTTAARLENSLSGCYARGMVRRGSTAWIMASFGASSGPPTGCAATQSPTAGHAERSVRKSNAPMDSALISPCAVYSRYRSPCTTDTRASIRPRAV